MTSKRGGLRWQPHGDGIEFKIQIQLLGTKKLCRVKIDQQAQHRSVAQHVQTMDTHMALASSPSGSAIKLNLR